MKLIVHTDGGARGNPGPAAVGVVIEGAREIVQFGKKIGETTNNVAEYMAVVTALEYLRNKKFEGVSQVNFFLDSTLVVNQLNGLFKVKDATLRQLLMKVRQLEGEVGGNISYAYVPREQNREADFMVNSALDA